MTTNVLPASGPAGARSRARARQLHAGRAQRLRRPPRAPRRGTSPTPPRRSPARRPRPRRSPRRRGLRSASIEPNSSASACGGHEPDVRDAEREQHAPERPLLRRLDRGDHVLGRPLLEPLERAAGRRPSAGRGRAAGATSPSSSSRAHELLADAVDVHRAARDEVLAATRSPGRAGPVGAAVHGLALGAAPPACRRPGSGRASARAGAALAAGARPGAGRPPAGSRRRPAARSRCRPRGCPCG